MSATSLPRCSPTNLNPYSYEHTAEYARSSVFFCIKVKEKELTSIIRLAGNCLMQSKVVIIL